MQDVKNDPECDKNLVRRDLIWDEVVNRCAKNVADQIIRRRRVEKNLAVVARGLIIAVILLVVQFTFSVAALHTMREASGVYCIMAQSNTNNGNN